MNAPPVPTVSLVDMPPYSAGQSSGGMVKLSANESPFAVPAFVRRAVRGAVRRSNRYPPRRDDVLVRLIARHLTVDERCVTLGNGSDELMSLIARGYIGRGDEVIIPQHTFSIYAHVTRLSCATPVMAAMRDSGETVDVARMLSLVSRRTRALFLATPNSPTGGYISAAEMALLCRELPSRVLIVIDHAYADFCTAADSCNGETMIAATAVRRDDRRAATDRGAADATVADRGAVDAAIPANQGATADAAPLAPRYPNVVVLRTFSKLYGIAGLRIGYAVSHPEIAAVLDRIRMPFGLNSGALAAAAAILKHHRVFAHRRDRIVVARDDLRARMIKLGYQPLVSHGNFICLPLPDDGARLVRFFHDRRVVVRPLHSFGLPNHIRITVGTKRANARVLRILAQWRWECSTA